MHLPDGARIEGVIAVESSAATFWRRAAMRISPKTLTWLFEQPQSVPRATVTTAAIALRSGVILSLRNMLLEGL